MAKQKHRFLLFFSLLVLLALVMAGCGQGKTETQNAL